MVGSIIEHYKIVSVLGEGGMGIVYQAFDLKLERFVAIKILSAQAINNPQFIERFKREAKNQAKLNHPNIVPVYGLTEENRTLGIVMEYVEGETLENIIQQKGRLELDEAVLILKQVLAGAGYAHSKGFVHRDFKPSNIIINENGVAKIMDFGISKSLNEGRGITKTGTKLGTILYMSPEQIKAMEPTAQSDIYSLGATFYEMLSGDPVFDYNTEFEIMEAHLKKEPAKLSGKFKEIPSSVDAVIAKAMSKSTAKRYADCDEFMADIDFLLTDTKPPIKKTKAKKTKRIKRTAPMPSTTVAVKAPLYVRLRFAAFALLFIFIFLILFYYVYTTITKSWNNGFGKAKIENNNTVNYSSNPSYVPPTEWKRITSPTSNNLNAVNFVSDSIGYACGNQGVIIKTINGGSSWGLLNDTSGSNLYSLKFFNTSTGFVVGENGTILFTVNSGETWQKMSSGVGESLFKIYFIKSTGIGFIVGGKGTILKSVDYGQTWNPVHSPTNKLLYCCAFSDPNNGIIVGWGGTVLRTQDQGNTWIQEDKFSDAYFRSISFADDNIGVLVGGGGIIARTNNDGKDWSSVNSSVASGLYAVYFLNNNFGLILGSKGEVLISKDAGKTWQQTSSGQFTSLTAVTATPSNRIFVVGFNGIILSSTITSN
jgi:eukaryotic-like serine/threonine-protein kinase